MSVSQFSLTREQELLLEQADAIGRQELAPHSEKMDNEEWWPPDLMAGLGRQGML